MCSCKLLTLRELMVVSHHFTMRSCKHFIVVLLDLKTSSSAGRDGKGAQALPGVPAMAPRPAPRQHHGPTRERARGNAAQQIFFSRFAASTVIDSVAGFSTLLRVTCSECGVPHCEMKGFGCKPARRLHGSPHPEQRQRVLFLNFC